MKPRHHAMALGASVLLAASLAAAQTPRAGAPRGPTARPKLVVILVVDQMRVDYLDRFRHQWTGGLKRLVESGAWFREAAYPYLNTLTCPGHATIGTGTLPATHTVAMNAWWDRASARQVTCTEDPQARAIGYGAPVKGGDSPHRLAVPTLAEEMRGQLGPGSRAATIATKARSAIMLAGHRGEAVTWFDATTGAWATSTAYAQAPLPFIEEFVKANPVSQDFGKQWVRRLPESVYLFRDQATGEKPRYGWTPAFPHALVGLTDKPDTRVFESWQTSPYSDAYVGRLAEATVDALGLGRGESTDFLGVSFGTLDWVGHDFGPRSHEVQDVLIALDGVIGSLLAHLDRTVGREHYVLALSADHGVAPIPEQRREDGLPAGRIVTDELAVRVDRALEPFLGAGPHVAKMLYPDLYFAPGVYAKLQTNPAARVAAVEAILATPGVARVFRGEELAERRSTDDGLARAAALSYVPGRSGDLIVVPRPYWFFVAASNETPPGAATTHGTAYAYDQRVPVILTGAGIKPGEYDQAAVPADIAPTLARLAGVTMPQSDGRVLAEALQATSPRR